MMPLEKIVQECDATTASLFIESQANKKSKLMYTLITGASSGIGKALSLECASRGMNLLLVALPGEELCELEKKILSQYRVACFSFGTDLSKHCSYVDVYNWVKDKYSYGGYSYEVVNGKEYREKVLEPVRNKLFFAGEGLYDGPEIGTVEAALITGREAAHTIISKE